MAESEPKGLGSLSKKLSKLEKKQNAVNNALWFFILSEGCAASFWWLMKSSQSYGGCFWAASEHGWEHHAVLDSGRLLFVADDVHFPKAWVRCFGTVCYTEVSDKAWLFSGLLATWCSLGVHVTQLLDPELLEPCFIRIVLLLLV